MLRTQRWPQLLAFMLALACSAALVLFGSQRLQADHLDLAGPSGWSSLRVDVAATTQCLASNKLLRPSPPDAIGPMGMDLASLLYEHDFDYPEDLINELLQKHCERNGLGLNAKDADGDELTFGATADNDAKIKLIKNNLTVTPPPNFYGPINISLAPGVPFSFSNFAKAIHSLIGLPLSIVSAVANNWAFASKTSAILLSIIDLSVIEVFPHLGKAACAASKAASTSCSFERATEQIVSFVIGLGLSKYLPDFGSTNFPLI